MNIDLIKYPTPRMDAAANRSEDQGQPWAKTLIHVLTEGKQLERELAACREALSEAWRAYLLNPGHHFTDALQNKISTILSATKGAE